MLANCKSNEDCLPTNTCVVAPRTEKENIVTAEKAWKKAGCGDYPECRAARPLCFFGHCAQPYQSHLYERAARIPKGMTPASRLNRSCLHKALSQAREQCLCGQPYSADLPRLGLELDLQPGKTENTIQTGSAGLARLGPLKGKLESCISTRLDGLGVARCFDGGWVQASFPGHHFQCSSGRLEDAEIGCCE
jgi:hypothetical protein